MGITWRCKNSIYMLETDILRNSSINDLGILRVLFKGLGVQKDTQTPCWLRPWRGDWTSLRLIFLNWVPKMSNLKILHSISFEGDRRVSFMRKCMVSLSYVLVQLCHVINNLSQNLTLPYLSTRSTLRCYCIETPVKVHTNKYLVHLDHVQHGLSQQGVWVSFWTPKPLKSTPQDTPQKLWRISWNFNLKHIIEFFHLHIIPMTLYKGVMLYFDKFIHVNGWNLSILWCPLKIWIRQNLTIANFGHPVSKSWLGPWCAAIGDMMLLF